MWSNEFSNNAITNTFVAWKHGHIVAAVLSRAQLCQIDKYTDTSMDKRRESKKKDKNLCKRIDKKKGPKRYTEMYGSLLIRNWNTFWGLKPK